MPRSASNQGGASTGQPESHMLAITRDGCRGYTANVGPGTVAGPRNFGKNLGDQERQASLKLRLFVLVFSMV